MTEIYVGGRIEHGSERDVLRRALSVLERDQRAGVILANLHLGGRQIDLIVALEESVLVIEAKGASRPIRGGENGPWQYRTVPGDWVDFDRSGNPYQQVLKAKHRVRDAMVAVAGKDIPLPDAAVVFVPGVPGGSKAWEGDFKASVGGLDDLDGLLRKQKESALTLDDWRAFADQRRLRRASGLESACDPALFEAEALVREYLAAFRRDHGQPGAVVPFACWIDERQVSSREVQGLIAEELADVVIQGPSGCGKTLIATKTTVALTDSGSVPVMISVKDYAGSLKAVLESEVRVLVGAPATKLLGAARALNRQLVFLVDGYNECAEADRAALTRRVAALARMYEAGVVVTSQIPLARGDRLKLLTVEVPPPDMDTKEAIALTWTGGAALPEQSRFLLEAVGSGLEARLVGEVGEQMAPGSSRHALFHEHARRRLGDSAAEGIRLLSHLAGWLSDRVSFSFSRRDLERQADGRGASRDSVCAAEGGFMVARGNRISFAHEMFFDAFAAENVIRRADGRAVRVLEALESPTHAGRKALIIGAIDDDLLRHEVLEGLADVESVAACLRGECGQEAREWAETRYTALWKDLRAEASGASFRIAEGGWWGVTFDGAKLRTWTPLEHALLAALPERVAKGRYLEVALDAVRVMDCRISGEEARLRDQAQRLRMPLKDALFACGLEDPSQMVAGVTAICRSVASVSLREPLDGMAEIVQAKLGAGNLSHSEVYLLLKLSRHGGLSARLVAGAIESHWVDAPYHLKIALMDAALMCLADDERDRRGLVSVIEELPSPENVMISTSMVEALQRLGALEDAEREHVDVVFQQIRECLADPGSVDSQAKAYSVYSRKFDHPYSGAYYETISRLPERDRKALTMMAAKGAPDTMAFLLPLLLELASFGDPDSGDCFSQWSALPPPDSFARQDAIVVFAVAHVALGRLGCPLPDQTGGDGYSAEALAACGAVLYWLNRHDLDRATKRRSCETPLRVLLRHDRGAALDVIRFCEHELRRWGLADGLKGHAGAEPPELSIVSGFPAEAVEVCRHALADPSSQIGYFGSGQSYDDLQNLPFAMDVLAGHGVSTDLHVLRGYRDDPALGTRAIAAVKVLEERLLG